MGKFIIPARYGCLCQSVGSLIFLSAATRARIGWRQQWIIKRDSRASLSSCAKVRSCPIQKRRSLAASCSGIHIQLADWPTGRLVMTEMGSESRVLCQSRPPACLESFVCFRPDRETSNIFIAVPILDWPGRLSICRAVKRPM